MLNEVLATRKKIPFEVGAMSLVGVMCPAYPFEYGNYCWIGPSAFSKGSYYCVNMWAENIVEFKKRNPDLTEVLVDIYEDRFCVVVDERIPIEWRNSFCLTGCMGFPARRNLEEMLCTCNVSPAKWICGCEAPEASPKIHMSKEADSPWVYRCDHCRNKWTVNAQGIRCE